VAADYVLKKFWQKTKYRDERYPLIPLIGPAIRHAAWVVGPKGKRGGHLYAAKLRVGRPGKRTHPKYLALYAHGGEHLRFFDTIYAKDDAKGWREEIEEQIEKGRLLWPPLHTSGRGGAGPRRRNPPPARNERAVSRASRTATNAANSTPHDGLLPTGWGALGGRQVLARQLAGCGPRPSPFGKLRGLRTSGEDPAHAEPVEAGARQPAGPRTQDFDTHPGALALIAAGALLLAGLNRQQQPEAALSVAKLKGSPAESGND
jgi:hypothetical protein